jgi:protein-arginine kinase activator protein McsA
MTDEKRHVPEQIEQIGQNGALLLPTMASARHNLGMGRKDKGREICINCGQTFHKKLTSKELRCTKCRKAEKKAA